jgi:hypothetical protein
MHKACTKPASPSPFVIQAPRRALNIDAKFKLWVHCYQTQQTLSSWVVHLLLHAPHISQKLQLQYLRLDEFYQILMYAETLTSH